METQSNLNNSSNPNPNSKAEMKRILQRLAQEIATEIGCNPSEVKQIEYPSDMCIHCYTRIGTLSGRLNLISDYEDPDAIWIGHMMCEKCNRLMRESTHTQTVIQKIADTLTFWLYSQDKIWASA